MKEMTIKIKINKSFSWYFNQNHKNFETMFFSNFIIYYTKNSNGILLITWSFIKIKKFMNIKGESVSEACLLLKINC